MLRTIYLLAIIATAASCQTENQIVLSDCPQECKAPMRYCEEPEDPFEIVPGSFIVYLIPGHSLEQHNQAVGTNMGPYITGIFSIVYPDKVVYTCEGVNDDLLVAIRKDCGVEWVGCDHGPGIPE
ncbi:hypothetical protein K469DRAFT_718807 [Zopfia rhizophila CBS 207.26]|uniref:Uncharacterized protein n=1 Tax=Zopfia rhizophila CBS 207.26 TaxID=1314779 RepID=A0A6A6ELZ7_9PEZI|nr:hypothetical protein K469DRAFT_718807 [Zopfia rhizophila CBS 207.26]